MDTLLAGARIPAGCGVSTVLADMDFETYSEAGYNFDGKKWRSVVKSAPHGLGAVGAQAYSEHPSTEVLSLQYDLKDGLGPRLWIPGLAPPYDLFKHISDGKLLEAYNSSFEYFIWANVCTPKLGWPPLDYRQLRDAMAKGQAFALPGKLGKAADALNAPVKKLTDGTRLIKKFSKPRNPTKHDKRLRVLPSEDLVDAAKLYEYNLYDIKSEAAVSAMIEDLPPDELELWLLDQKINFKGAHIDTEALNSCIAIVRQAEEQYTAELPELTNGYVNSPSEIQKIREWVLTKGVDTPSLTADDVEALLSSELLPPDVRRVLEIRATLGSASVKKLFSINNRLSKTGRLCGLFAYCGANRTGRFAGRGPQPQNLPNHGPDVFLCSCKKHYGTHLNACPWCGLRFFHAEKIEWSINAVEDALSVIKLKDLSTVEYFFGNAIALISGCLRGLFSAAPGYDLICSDYSAIEAVVLAVLAGEEWRIEVFKTHGKIYEMSASKITGIPFDDFLEHKKTTGDHHPMRKKVGKVAELAGGFGGGIGAWKAFGADKFFNSDAEIQAAVKAWREASPMIVKFWYGLQDAAHMAVKYPGQCFEYRGISYGVKNDVLYCKLLSGRRLAYHQPRLIPDVTPWGREVFKLTYMGWNGDRKKGPIGWIRLDTWGGKLAENVTQATARDLLTYAMINLDKAGYDIVLHVHDEVVSEVLKSFGTVEEFENIMATVPPWAEGWPVRAAGGWRGERYRKD